MMKKYRIQFFVFLWFAAICFMPGNVLANQKTSSKIEYLPETKILLSDFKNAIQTKNYTILERYTKKYKTIDWINCGPTDGDPLKHSVAAMMKLIKSYSRGVQIYIDDNPEIITLNRGSVPPFVEIETEGWANEYPYLAFSFQYENETLGWQWVGVCYSAEPPLVFTNRGVYEQRYKKAPVLPRPGPRIFKDYSSLRYRFKEIVKFRALEALKPYAVKKKLLLAECSRDMAASGKIKGTKVSSDQVINFLKQNIADSQGINPRKGGSSDYLDTEGWQGSYPYISFWFQETKKGWEWAGVAYCKSSLTHLLFPDEPRFK